jgi:hypothetical protein
MAALSDYLESGLLSHIFRNAAFPRPSTIAIALTSGVPLDSNDGTNIPELKSSVQDGDLTRSTNYSRVNLFNPATSGDNTWNAVGVDATTAYSVSGNKRDGSTGYFYPLYLNQQAALSHSGGNGTSTVYTFDNIFPSVVFYGPNGTNVFSSGTQSKSSYPDYEGNGFIRNKNQIVFNTALTEWGWVSGIAILDNSGVGSGNLLMYSKLANPRYVYIGDNIRFDANSLEISLK